MSALTFQSLPATDEPSPTVAEIRSALTAHPGQWAVVLRADRLARAETYRDAVDNGVKFGPGFRAAIRKEGPVFRVFASYSA
jgi:hypothetical protein